MFLRKKSQNSEMLFQMPFMLIILNHSSSRDRVAIVGQGIPYRRNIGWCLKFRDASEDQVLQTVALTVWHLHHSSKDSNEGRGNKLGQPPKIQLLKIKNFIGSQRGLP